MGKQLLHRPEAYNVSAVLIHDVIRNHQVRSTVNTSDLQPLMAKTQSHRWDECQLHGLHLFRTYVGAAFQLYASQSLSLAAVVKVVQQTVTGYEAIAFDSPAQKQRLAHEIMTDVRQLMEELPSQEALALASALPSDLLAAGKTADEMV